MESVQPTKPKWEIGDVALILLALAGFTLLNSLWSDSLQKILKSGFGPVTGQLAYFAMTTSLQGIMIAGLVIYIVRRNGQSFRELGLVIPSLGKVLVYGLVGGLLLLGLGLVSSSLIEFLTPRPPEPQPIAKAIAQAGTWSQLLLPLFVAAAIAPISEELFLRGFTYPVLREHFGLRVGMLFSAVFFAALHFDLLRFIPLAMAGWGLTWLYQKTGSLITPMLAHGVWNTLMTLVVFKGS
ncbi:MAG: CPBP family intramembrane metalloprotease [Clostridia bacterium]|nr:CPBP family intramembrane metalloprotease [Clostridia bacterium]